MAWRLLCLLSFVLVVGLAGGVSNGALIAYYNFGTSTATSANQGTAGSAADGILINGATIVDIDTSARGVEWALQLNNTTGSTLADCQYMNITNGDDSWYDSAIGSPTGARTYAAWVRMDTSTTQDWSMFMSKGFDTAFAFGCGTPSGNGMDQVVFSHQAGIASWSPLKGTVSVMHDSCWTHVVATIDGADYKTASLYINGVLQDSRQTWGPLYENDLDLLIGAEPNRTGYQFGWNGMIDDVRIYDEHFDAQDAMDLFVNTYRQNCCCFLDVDADAGGPYQVDPGGTVILDGSGSSEGGSGYGLYLDWYIGGEYVGTDIYTETLSISYDTLVCDIGLSPGIYEVLVTGCEWVFGCGACCDNDVTTIEIGPAYPDINDDNKINLVDFVILASQWLETPGMPSADISPYCSGDGIVDLNDLGMLTEDWLWEEP
ncbi:MAG: LamG-like jellyroll fold domain-containing protein [Planctomycetota bacterium]|jgi:hypothetical protein